MSEGRRQAILIAASEFPDEPSLATLRCPQNDVAGLAEVLASPEFGLFADPLLYVNQPHHATLRAINRVFKQAARADQILIYYSGHGKLDGAGRLHLTTTDTEADALETSSIPVSTLLRLIENYDCKQVALILDCCFSGAVGKEFKSGVDDQLQQVAQTRGVFILTASTSVQTAAEKEGDQYSLFTKHILHGIKQGEADCDNDGLVSIDDLYEYTRLRVPLEGAQQPRKWTLDAQGGKLAIARTAAFYSAEKLRAFRDVILGIEDEIDDEVFADAIRVIKQNQQKRDKAFFKLLNDLLEQGLKPAKFSGQWLRDAGLIGQPRQPEQKPAKPPERQQTPAPAPQQTKPRESQQAPVAAPSRQTKPPDSKTVNGFSDDLNGVKLEMIYVPGGEFTMGSDKYDSEKPPHKVTVPAFYIGKFQVTQAQWKAVMGDKLKPGFKGDDNLPMESVSWDDAREFCQKLQELTKKAYRLPSEAEWEYACRADTTTEFAFGDSLSSKQANFDGNYPYGDASKAVYRKKTTPVGSYDPNAFGLYDMHGNVWEWCEDVWHDNYKGAPTDGSAWLSGGDSSRRVLRGGSWSNDGDDCRSAYRNYYEPGVRVNVIGFRVVVSARTSDT
jgi:formylglycine-generating enzyme required for sulfatase activity